MTSPLLARRALATLISMSRGELLAALPEIVSETWLARALRDASPSDVQVLGCFSTTNRAKESWPCCVVRVHRPSQGLGHPERETLLAAYFDEAMRLRVQVIREAPRKFLGSAGGKAGVLNGDGGAGSAQVPATEPAPSRRKGRAPAARNMAGSAALSL
jgi:hypothetical protein